MKPFVVNRLGRLVFPSNFFPELDFTVWSGSRCPHGGTQFLRRMHRRRRKT